MWWKLLDLGLVGSQECESVMSSLRAFPPAVLRGGDLGGPGLRLTIKATLSGGYVGAKGTSKPGVLLTCWCKMELILPGVCEAVRVVIILTVMD